MNGLPVNLFLANPDACKFTRPYSPFSTTAVNRVAVCGQLALMMTGGFIVLGKEPGTTIILNCQMKSDGRRSLANPSWKMTS
jgi:hypothetical protein